MCVKVRKNCFIQTESWTGVKFGKYITLHSLKHLYWLIENCLNFLSLKYIQYILKEFLKNIIRVNKNDSVPTILLMRYDTMKNW